MLKIEGVDLELQQIGNEPTMGFSDEYTEKYMVSGRIRRIYKGKRFSGSWSYAFLTDEQIETVRSLLELQRSQGYLDVEMSSPYGSFSGHAVIDLSAEQTRFTYDRKNQKYTWVGWELTVTAVDYDI